MVPLLYALFTSLGTVGGGLMPIYTRLKEVEMRYMLAFAAGAMVSVALFELVPEAHEGGLMAVPIGFFLLYLIEKAVMLHACREAECEAHTVGWVALIGIAAESLIDGIAIKVGYEAAPTLGLLVALAVLSHEIPRGFATTVIMKASNYRLAAIFGALAVDAGLTPIGALVGGAFPSGLFAPTIGFAAGAFIYVGASDLLPEAHKRFNLAVVACVLAGAALIPLLEALLGLH